jgi:hypothetical protein
VEGEAREQPSLEQRELEPTLAAPNQARLLEEHFERALC